ncbi:Unknown protein, partial [Striga hermonthica]
VIGLVVETHPIQIKNVKGGPTQMINFTLMDLDGLTMTCTVWGSYVDQFIAFVNYYVEANDPFVLIMQMCRAKPWNGEVQVTTSKDVTHLIGVHDIAEVQDFLEKMSTTKLKSVKLRSNSSLVVKSEFQGLEDGDVIVSSVDSLHETEEAMDTWVCASIDSIIDNWWYLACKRCNSKMNCEDGDMHCTKCTNTRGTARYKIQFGVHDCTASGVFLCWDRECERMIGKSCEILKREVSLLKNKAAFDLPDDLEDLVGRTFLFKVRIKANDTFSAAYSVLRVIVDSNLVSKYNHWVVENDESDFLTLLQREEATK